MVGEAERVGSGGCRVELDRLSFSGLDEVGAQVACPCVCVRE